jgi:hypothetical protein
MFLIKPVWKLGVHHCVMLCWGISVHRRCLWPLPKVGSQVAKSDKSDHRLQGSKHSHFQVVFNKDFEGDLFEVVTPKYHGTLQRHWHAQCMLVIHPKSGFTGCKSDKSDQKWQKVTVVKQMLKSDWNFHLEVRELAKHAKEVLKMHSRGLTKCWKSEKTATKSDWWVTVESDRKWQQSDCKIES